MKNPMIIMNIKKHSLFTAAVCLLVGAPIAAQAQDVIFDPVETDRATGITDLNVGGTLYDVTFTA